MKWLSSYIGTNTATRKHSFKSRAINGRAKGGRKKRNCRQADGERRKNMNFWNYLLCLAPFYFITILKTLLKKIFAEWKMKKSIFKISLEIFWNFYCLSHATLNTRIFSYFSQLYVEATKCKDMNWSALFLKENNCCSFAYNNNGLITSKYFIQV